MARRTRTPSADLDYYRANLDAVWREDGVVKVGDTEFVELIRQGMTDTEIAARFGLRRATVISKRCHLRKRGLLPPRPPATRTDQEVLSPWTT